MAAGEVNLQANDLRIATVTFEDGAAGNVSVVVPKEGGTLASEAHVASQSYNKTEADALLVAKQATLVSGTNIKTINSTSLLGSGDIVVSTSPPTTYGAIGTYVIAACSTMPVGTIYLPNVSVQGSSLCSNVAQAASSFVAPFSATGSTNMSITYPSVGITSLLGTVGTWINVCSLSRGATAGTLYPMGLWLRIA